MSQFPLVPCVGIEGDLDGAEATGAVGVVERLAPAVQRVGRDALGELGDRVAGDELGGDVEGAAAAGLDAGGGVGADDLELAEPGGGQVGGGGHPGQHDATTGPGGVERRLQRALAADGVDGDVDPAEEVRRARTRA